MFVSLLSLLAVSMFAPLPDTLGDARRTSPQGRVEKAICQVCFMRGEGTTPEKVKASTVFEGTSYYFCSRECQKAFEAEPAGFVPSSLPSPAPSFSVRDLNGNLFDRERFKDRVLLLDFWATWCKPCVKTMPVLTDLQQDYEGNLAVLGISIDEDPGVVKKFVAKHAPGYPIAVDDRNQPAWRAYRVKAIPTAFLIDQNGILVGRWIGPLSAGQVASAIDSLLGDPNQGAK